MGFGAIIGHGKQLAILRRALAGARLHHAYLFVGPEGVGKHTIAIALAKAIHCLANEPDFCGQCVNCSRIADGNHPDVRIVEPLADKKEISIKQVRDAERELNYRSFTGKRKIVIFDPAALMNLASQNALLKTLEEPPRDCLLILIASNAGGLLPTVRSRCLRVSFAPLARQDIAQFLRSERGMSGDEVEFLAAFSMGSIGAALSLDQKAFMEKRRVWAAMVSALHSQDYRSAMAAAEALAGSRDEALEFLSWAATWYRDLLIYGATRDAKELVNLDLRQQIEKMTAEMVTQRTLSSLAETAKAGARMQRNLNRRMVLEKLLFGALGGR